MWLLGIFKKKRREEELPSLLLEEWTQTNEGEGYRTSDSGIFATVSNLPSKPHYNASYLAEKLDRLREEAELYQYESNFVSPNLLDESWFLEKMKSKLEELWKTLLVILLLGKATQQTADSDWSDTEEMGYEEVVGLIEEMSPWLKKTVLQNLLKKIAGEQNILQQNDITDEEKLIGSLKVDLTSLEEARDLLVEVEQELNLCRPDELDLDLTDLQSAESKQEYTKFYNLLFARKRRLEQLIKIYTNYIVTVVKLYEAKKKLGQTSEEETTKQVTDQFVFHHKGDPLLFWLEEQELEEKIKQACEPIQIERNELQTMIEKLEKSKVDQTLKILDMQWVLFYAPYRERSLDKWITGEPLREAAKIPGKRLTQGYSEYYYCQIRKSTKKDKPDVREYYRVTVTQDPISLTILPIDHVTVMSQLEWIDSKKRREIIELLTQDPTEWEVALRSTLMVLLETPQQIALQQQVMRSEQGWHIKLFDKCDDLLTSWFVEYGEDEYGDVCVVFPTLGLSVRQEYLRPGWMKVGSYRDGINDYMSWTGKWSQLGAKNLIYKNTIDRQKQARKDEMDEDCYNKWYQRQTKAHYDTILNALARRLWLTYNPHSTGWQPVLKAYMYLKGMYGREWMNTEFQTWTEWGKYWQYIGKRCFLCCTDDYLRFSWFGADNDVCSIPLIKIL